jgi:hypothetical protein
MNPSLLVKFILTRGGSMASPSLVHHSEYSARPPKRRAAALFPLSL